MRDPQARKNLAVLSPSAFAAPRPIERQTWRLRVNEMGVQALREYPRLGLEFAPGDFAQDPRLQAMVWRRDRA